MANSKISNLPLAGSLDGTEVMAIVQDFTTKKIAITTVLSAIGLSDYLKKDGTNSPMTGNVNWGGKYINNIDKLIGSNLLLDLTGGTIEDGSGISIDFTNRKLYNGADALLDFSGSLIGISDGDTNYAYLDTSDLLAPNTFKFPVKVGTQTFAMLSDLSGFLTGNQTITLSGDISGSGSTSISATIGAGKVTNSMLAGSIDLASKVTGVLPGANGGTGVANTGKTITLGGNLTLSGAYALTLTQTASTNVTLPTTGTLATLAGAETFTNKTYDFGNINLEKGSTGGVGFKYNVRGKTNGDYAGIWVMPKGDPNTTNGSSVVKIFCDDFEYNATDYRDQGLISMVDGGIMGSGRHKWNAKQNGVFHGSVQDLVLSLRDEAYFPMRATLLQPTTADSYDGSGNNVFNFGDNPVWKTGTAITAGKYIINDYKIYKATTSGTTGSTIPTHTAGTVSDGGVSWQFLVNYSGVPFDPVVIFGDLDDSTLRTTVAIGKTGYGVHYLTNQLIYSGKEISFIRTDKTDGARIYAQTANTGYSLYLEGKKGSGSYQRITDKIIQPTNLTNTVADISKTNAATSLDVDAGCNVVKFNDSALTIFTELTNQKQDAYYYFVFNTGNTILKHSDTKLVLPEGRDINPAAGSIYTFYARDTTKLVLVKGYGDAVQKTLKKFSVWITTQASSAVQGQGCNITSVGTVTHPTPTQTYGYMANFATGAVANNTAGSGNSANIWVRGNTTGVNGFKGFERLALPDASYGSGATGSRIFVGYTDQSMAQSVGSDNPSGNRCGFSFSTNRGDTNWQFSTKDNTTENLVNTGLAFTAAKVYEFNILCDSSGSSIKFKVDNITDGTTSGWLSTGSNLPAGATYMKQGFQLATLDTVDRNIRMEKVYSEI